MKGRALFATLTTLLVFTAEARAELCLRGHCLTEPSGVVTPSLECLEVDVSSWGCDCNRGLRLTLSNGCDRSILIDSRLLGEITDDRGRPAPCLEWCVLDEGGVGTYLISEQEGNLPLEAQEVGRHDVEFQLTAEDEEYVLTVSFDNEGFDAGSGCAVTPAAPRDEDVPFAWLGALAVLLGCRRLERT